MKKISQIKERLSSIENVDFVNHSNNAFVITMYCSTFDIPEDNIFHSAPLLDVIINLDKNLNLTSILVGYDDDKNALEKFNSIEEMQKAGYYTSFVINALKEVEKFKKQ